MSDSVLDYLGSHTLLTLATASKNGIPHATPSFYANDGTTVYFSVSADSITAQNLAENPVAAVAVSDVPEEWSKSKGAQLSGAVDKAEGDDAANAAELFAGRYPFLGDSAKTATYYKLTPHDVRYTDNTSGGDESKQALGVSWSRSVAHRVFRALRPDELEELTGKLAHETRKSGETLIEQGTEGTHFYIIVEGEAQTTNSDGKVLSTVGPGGFVGEIAILAGRPRTATVTAKTDLTVAALTKADFESIVATHPELRREMTDVMSARLARG